MIKLKYECPNKLCGYPLEFEFHKSRRRFIKSCPFCKGLHVVLDKSGRDFVFIKLYRLDFARNY